MYQKEIIEANNKAPMNNNPGKCVVVKIMIVIFICVSLLRAAFYYPF